MTTQNETQSDVATDNQQLAPLNPRQLASIERQRDMDGTTFSREAGPFTSGTAFQLAVRMAEMLANSTILPTEYRGNPANVLVAIDYASRLGVSPVMLAQNMDIVKGRPGLRGTFLVALINSSPKWKDIDFEWQGTDSPGGTPTPDYGCRVLATRVSDGKLCVGNWIDWRMVVGEGWVSNKKWEYMRNQMFVYRAASFWSRQWAPDVTLGLHESNELLELGDDILDVRHTPHASRVNAMIDGATDSVAGETTTRTTGRGRNRRTFAAAAAPAKPAASNNYDPNPELEDVDEEKPDDQEDASQAAERGSPDDEMHARTETGSFNFE